MSLRTRDFPSCVALFEWKRIYKFTKAIKTFSAKSTFNISPHLVLTTFAIGEISHETRSYKLKEHTLRGKAVLRAKTSANTFAQTKKLEETKRNYKKL